MRSEPGKGNQVNIWVLDSKDGINDGIVTSGEDYANSMADGWLKVRPEISESAEGRAWLAGRLYDFAESLGKRDPWRRVRQDACDLNPDKTVCEILKLLCNANVAATDDHQVTKAVELTKRLDAYLHQPREPEF